MSATPVHDILQLIDSLSPDDRAVLELQLSQRLEVDWQQEVLTARRQAQARGIDQSAIDDAVRQVRYGS